MDRLSSRREWLRRSGQLAAGVCLAPPLLGVAPEAPTAPVAVAKCKTYGTELAPTLARMFDQLGGLGKLVKGKTIAIKLNMTALPNRRLGNRPVELAQWVHPAVIAATVHFLSKAGAQRIRLLESPSSAEPIEELMLAANWEPDAFVHAAPRVEFENTSWLGNGKKYSRLRVPGGGYAFPAFDVNHSYEDCDVFVSLAKLKEHIDAGVTLSMKNCFGITPLTIYGDGAGEDEPSRLPSGGRSMLHYGKLQPSRSALPENDLKSPRLEGYRLPRIIVDLVAARPIHLAIIDGIETMAGGEGPWAPDACPASPGVLIGGTNCVTTDAVATAVMGYDPMADRGKPPFVKCDSTLRLAEDLRIGTRDLERIEVLGTPIREAKTDFAALRRRRSG